MVRTVLTFLVEDMGGLATLGGQEVRESRD